MSILCVACVWCARIFIALRTIPFVGNIWFNLARTRNKKQWPIRIVPFCERARAFAVALETIDSMKPFEFGVQRTVIYIFDERSEQIDTQKPHRKAQRTCIKLAWLTDDGNYPNHMCSAMLIAVGRAQCSNKPESEIQALSNRWTARAPEMKMSSNRKLWLCGLYTMAKSTAQVGGDIKRSWFRLLGANVLRLLRRT